MIYSNSQVICDSVSVWCIKYEYVVGLKVYYLLGTMFQSLTEGTHSGNTQLL